MDDVETIFDIRTSVSDNFMSMQELAEAGVTPQAVADELRGTARAWMAEIDGAPVGFVMARGDSGKIHGMFVRPGFQGRGLGALLMAQAERFLFGTHDTIWLTTGTGEHIRSNAFYRKLGWTAVAPAPNDQTRYEKRRADRQTVPNRMILFPAIDLKDGACVRLKLGDMAQATVYNTDPADQARAFEAQGFSWLHVVDLDGAFAGESRNGAAVDAILNATGNPVQLGGGIRTLSQIEAWLDKGVRRVILGTVAVRDPTLVKEACARFPGRVAVGIDAKGGKVAVEGWAEASSLDVIELARKFEGAGVAAIVYTDIDRDGVLAGINWDATLALAEAVSIPVIASGGLASIADIVRMTMPDAARLEGAISGRALYDGRINPAQALAILSGNSAPPRGLLD